jgi:hypothetical protein
MTHHAFPLRQLALAAVLCAAGAANATITFVTSAANPAFAAASTDTFSDLPINSDLQTLSLSRKAGNFRYTLGTTFNDATYSDLFTVPVAGTDGVSTGWYTDSLIFTILSPSVLAFGGNFYGTNILGETSAGALTITVTDIAGTTRTQAIAGGSASAFSGFISDVPLRLAVVSITTPNTNVWATVDNVALSAVPEPSTWAMMLLAGGAAALRIGARRRG